MADYLKKFATQSEYDAYIQAGYPKPNVSYIVDNDEIIFTNYQDGEAGPERVLLGMKTEDFTGTVFQDPKSYIAEVYIPEGVTTIGGSAFYNCSGLTSATISNSVTSIGNQAFYQCTSLASVTIGNSVTAIGDSAFTGTALTSVTIPDSVTTIGESVFQNCKSLTSVTIGNSVTTIGTGAFNSCSSLTSVDIPDSVTTISKMAFIFCSGLTSATIGNSVTSIGIQAFYYCTALTSVTVKATTPPTLASNAFQSTHANLVIYVPAESVDAYKAAENWSKYASKIQAITE